MFIKASDAGSDGGMNAAVKQMRTGAELKYKLVANEVYTNVSVPCAITMRLIPCSMHDLIWSKTTPQSEGVKSSENLFNGAKVRTSIELFFMNESTKVCTFFAPTLFSSVTTSPPRAAPMVPPVVIKAIV
jgi:hypothetical protein